MERKKEVSAKLGPDNVSTLLAEVEAGRVTEMKQLALAMHDKVHGEFVYQKDKTKPADLMKILLDKWFAVELYKHEVNGVKRLEEVLRECDLDYLVAKLNLTKKRPSFLTLQQMEEERLAEEWRHDKLEGGLIISESGVVTLDELKGQQVNIFAVGGGGSLGDYGGGGSGHVTLGQLLVPESGRIKVNIGQGGEYHSNGGDTVVEAGQESLTAGGGEPANGHLGGGGWSGGGGGGSEKGGRGGSNGGDGQAGTGRALAARGGRGSGAGLPRIPGLTLAPGRGGQPDSRHKGGGGGVMVNGRPEWRIKSCGEGFGAGGGGAEGTNGVVIIFA